MRRARWSVVVLLVFAGCLSGVGGIEEGGTTDAATTADGTTAEPPTATPPGATEGVRVRVVEVIDGDTVRVRFANDTQERVRLVGIDTPEVHAENEPADFDGVPDTEAGRSCLREHGERASGFVKERLTGREVRLVFDANEPRRDFYDRLLAYVVVDNRSVNRLLVARGYARVYRSGFTERTEYERLETEAREANRGVWTCRTDGGSPTGTPSTVATGTPAKTEVVVTEIHADAAGNDNQNLNDEYVTIENAGEEPVDLSGWTVGDEAGHVYEFGDRQLGPGERVTLHTDSGEDTDRHVYWGRERAVWNNDGDTVTVRDASGSVVVRESYP